MKKPVAFDFIVRLIPNVGEARTLQGTFSTGLAAKWRGEHVAKQWFASEQSPDSIEVVVTESGTLVPKFSRMMTPEEAR